MTTDEKQQQKEYYLNPKLCPVCQKPLSYYQFKYGRTITCGQICSKEIEKQTKNKKTIKITNHTTKSCIEVKNNGKTNNSFKYCAIDNNGVLSIVNPPDYSDHPVWIYNLKRQPKLEQESLPF